MPKVTIKEAKELREERLSELGRCWDDPRERLNKKHEENESYIVFGMLAVLTVVALIVVCVVYDKL